jgi:hypothetical protein
MNNQELTVARLRERRSRIDYPGALYHVIARGDQRQKIFWSVVFIDARSAGGRNWVAYLARKLTGTRVKEIARCFYREPMTMSLGGMKIENRLQRDKDFAGRVAFMEMNLRKRGKKKYFITIAPFTQAS